MGWSIYEQVSGLIMPITLAAGDVSFEESWTTAVHTSLDGTTWVTDSPGKATPILPELVFRTPGDFENLRAIRNLSRRVILTDDLGRGYPVKFVGPITRREIDTPDRANGEVLIYAKVTFIGVD